MQSKDILTRTSLRTPKAAAIAGIVFSILLVVIVSLLRLSVPDDPLEPGAWLSTNSKNVATCRFSSAFERGGASTGPSDADWLLLEVPMLTDEARRRANSCFVELA